MKLFWWIVMTVEGVSNNIHWWSGRLLAKRQSRKLHG